MNTAAMIYPMAALALITFGVMGALLAVSTRLVNAGAIDPKYFEVREGTPPPPAHNKVSRHLTNLFEMPVLFYAGTLAVIATATVDAIFVWMAWAYVAIRVVHLLIHTTYNNVNHRASAYVLGNLVLLVFWARLIIAVS